MSLAARNAKEPERRCVVTRQTGSRGALIRFVQGPGGELVPDVAERLPGRGVWVTGTRDTVETAARSKAFGRGLKAQITVPDGLADTIDRLLADRARSMMAIANKAGALVLGFEKIKAALVAGDVVALFHANEARADGRDRLNRLAAHCDVPPVLMPAVFSIDELSLALGRENVVHGALIESGVASAAEVAVRRLAVFRGMVPLNSESEEVRSAG